MDRRYFATGTAAALVPTAALPRKLARKEEPAWFSSYVANVADALGDVPVPVQLHDPVRLVALSDELYDPHAIAVTTVDGTLLGRLPTSQCRAIRSLMDSGVALSAQVGEVRHIPRPAIRIEIAIGEPVAA